MSPIKNLLSRLFTRRTSGNVGRSEAIVQPLDDSDILDGIDVTDFLREKPQRQRRPVRAMRKRVRFGLLPVLEAVAFLLVLVFGGGAFLLWRVQQGTVSLDWARGYVEDALAASDSGDTVSIGALTASWVESRRAVRLLAAPVDSLDSSGNRLARANKIAIEFQPEQILVGRSSFSRFESEGGLFSVVLRSSGKVDSGIGTPEVVLKRKSRPDAKRLEKILEAVDAAWRGEGGAGGLNFVSMQNARVVFFDERSRRYATGLNSVVSMRRMNSVVSGRVTLDLRSGSAPLAKAHLVFAGSAPGPLKTRLTLTKFSPAAFLPPDIAPVLQSIAAPVDADAYLRLDEKGGIADASLDASATAGRLVVDGESRALNYGVLKARYDPEKDSLVLSRLEGSAAGASLRATGQITSPMQIFGRVSRYESSEFDIDAPIILWTTPHDKNWVASKTGQIKNLKVSGRIFKNGDRVVIDDVSGFLDRGAVRLNGEARRGAIGKAKRAYSIKARGSVVGPVAVEAVLTFWPPQIVKGAREWLGRALEAGEINSVSLNTDLSAAAVAEGRIPDAAINLRFAFDHAALRPYDGSFLISDASGLGRLGGDSFKLTANGRSGSILMENASVDIARIHGDNRSPLVIKTSARGDVPGFAKMFAQDMDQAAASRLGGDGLVKFSMSRPLRSEVPWDEIVMNGRASFNGVRIENVIGPLSMEGGRFEVSLDRDRLLAKGGARVGGQPVNVSWQETIRPGKGPTTQVSMGGVADASILDNFGVPSRAALRGSFGAEVFASGERLRITRGVVNLNLAQMDISPQGMKWRKPKGVTGQFTLAFNRVSPDAPSSFSINALTNGATMNASGVLGANGRMTSGDLMRFYIPGAFDFSGRLRQDQKGRRLDIKGALVEGRTVLGLIFRGGGDQTDTAQHLPLRVSAAFDQVYAEDQPTLKALTFDGDLDDGRVNRAKMHAQTINGKSLNLSVTPGGTAGDRRLRLDMDDLGAASRFVIRKGQVRGGTGYMEGRLYQRNGKESADLALHAKDFELRGTPALARLLTFGSLRGLADALNGDGIKFSSMQAPLKFQDNTMRIDEARAVGPAIGITVKGDLNFDDETMDVNGVLAPSYGVNSVLGNVPLVGKVLVSRKGEGVFGMTYSMQGPMDDARTRVNPLSVLTPGILRRVFEPGTPVAEKETPGSAKD